MSNIRATVQRSNVNETNVKFSDFPKSGIDLSYRSQCSGKLGKLHVAGYQFIMPNDKISGETHVNIQFEPLSVPMIAPIDVHTHNFYVPFRDVIGSDFEEFMSPENGFEPDVPTLPMFTLRSVISYFLSGVINFPDLGSIAGSTIDFADAQSFYTTSVPLYLSSLKPVLVSSKLGDFYDEYVEHLNSLGAPTSSDFVEWLINWHTFALQPFVGEGSHLDFLGYPILDNRVIRIWIENWYGTDLSNLTSDLPLSELPLRCLWAVWFDRYRNVNVERKRDFYALGLNYKKWSAAPLNIAVLIHLLFPRYRNWSRDMFTSAMVDDPARHVYAQISEEDTSYSFVDDSNEYTPAESSLTRNLQTRGVINQTLHYLDVDGVERDVVLPIPSSLVAPLSVPSPSVDGTSSLSLDLLSLRRAKMFENYLKRNQYYGDEYQDRMAAHYGSRVSDSRVNRPEYLSGNTSQVNTQQTVANMTNDDTDAGQRTAYMDAQQDGGDRFDFYCEEFGMVLTIISLTPAPYYDPMPAQLMSQRIMDFPFPEFANQAEELSRRCMLARTAVDSYVPDSLRPFGHHPQYVAWRSRVNDLHGNALSTRRFYTFSRVWSYVNADNTPYFNSTFVHCRPSLDMFISNDPLNDLWFGMVDKIFYVERVLPQVTEVL